MHSFTMKITNRKSNWISRLFPVLILLSGFGFSQSQSVRGSQEGEYLVFDSSKSFQGNELIDHLQFLISNSESTVLPANVESMLNAVQEDPQIHSKLTWMRASVLKVLYNERISPEDKRFISKHYANYPPDGKYGPIQPMLRAYLKDGSL